MFLKPPLHSGIVDELPPGFKGGKNPPPYCLTSVKVWGSPPWLTTERIVPCLMVSWSGSKSHPGSGVPFCAPVIRSDNVVANPKFARATFLQKSAPAAVGAVNVVGSTHRGRRPERARMILLERPQTMRLRRANNRPEKPSAWCFSCKPPLPLLSSDVFRPRIAKRNQSSVGLCPT